MLVVQYCKICYKTIGTLPIWNLAVCDVAFGLAHCKRTLTSRHCKSDIQKDGKYQMKIYLRVTFCSVQSKSKALLTLSFCDSDWVSVLWYFLNRLCELRHTNVLKSISLRHRNRRRLSLKQPYKRPFTSCDLLGVNYCMNFSVHTKVDQIPSVNAST